MMNDDDIVIVEWQVSDRMLKANIDVHIVAEDCRVFINGREFKLLEILSACLACGDEIEQTIDNMRVQQLTGEHVWFKTMDRSD